MEKKKRVVIALGGNALGNTLPEQMAAVKITAKAIVDLIEDGCEVVVSHGNGPQVGMVNNAMIALTHEDAAQSNTPLSVCVAMSQAYIGYDLQNALREELLNRNISNVPVATMITQVRVDENDPAFQNPSKPIGKFVDAEQAKKMEESFHYIMKEDSGRGYRRVVASPKPVEIIEIETIRTMALQVNEALKAFFAGCGVRLIDFKLEFGRLPDGTIVLADEISPDTCRFWDAKTNEKLDKDRFRRDLGGVGDITPELEHRKSGYVERKWRPYQSNVVRYA